MDNYVELRDVRKIYKMGEVEIAAADGINFAVGKGEFAVVVGALVAVLIFGLSDFIAGTVMKLELSAYALRVLAPGLFIVAVMPTLSL